jgi:hypothetical protein
MDEFGGVLSAETLSLRPSLSLVYSWSVERIGESGLDSWIGLMGWKGGGWVVAVYYWPG